MVPDPALLERFRADLDALSAPGQRIGIAVSGGPDSLALLLLAAAARPGLVEAATVDHGLRAESRAEAEMVARICAELLALAGSVGCRVRTRIHERERSELPPAGLAR